MDIVLLYYNTFISIMVKLHGIIFGTFLICNYMYLLLVIMEYLEIDYVAMNIILMWIIDHFLIEIYH